MKPLISLGSILLACCLIPAASFGAQQSGLIKPGATVRCLADGLRFTEGPACDADGNIYFSDIPSNRIMIWTLNGDLKVYREKSGGANGLYFDSDGTLVICEGGARRLVRDNLKGRITVLADSFDGKKLNSPNDLWIDPTGGIYFTDPRYGKTENLEQDGMHVYYLPRDGTLKKVATDLQKPNGIIGTLDGKTLYIADEGAKKIWVYSIGKDGSLKNKRLFTDQGSDGMTMDEHGNLYLADKKIDIYSPQGQWLESIAIPEQPSNLTFGGKDKKTLFITARTSFYCLDMQVSGADKAVPPFIGPVKK